MADIPFATRFGIASVKDGQFGAVGDGSHDDTAALQAALDYCFGPPNAPNGAANSSNNIVFYVPPGQFKVRSPPALTVTAVQSNGGKIQLVTSSTAGWKSSWLVTVSGVTTSGLTYVNGIWGITVDDSSHITLYKNGTSTFTTGGSVNAGSKVSTAALHMAQVVGGILSGSGKEVSTIANDGGNGTLDTLSINGFDGGVIEKMSIVPPQVSTTTPGGIGLDLGYDGRGPVPTRSVLITDCALVGQGVNTAGVRIGAGGGQCSGTVFNNCYLAASQKITVGSAALRLIESGSIMTQIHAGNISSAEKAIHVTVGGGSVPGIYGVSFENNGTDIYVEQNSGMDMYHISGTRVEGSDNFLRFYCDSRICCSACAYDSAGVFAYFEGTLIVDNCEAYVPGAFGGGIDPASKGKLFIRGSTFAIRGDPVWPNGGITTLDYANGGRVCEYDVDGLTIGSDASPGTLPTPTLAWTGCRTMIIDCNQSAVTRGFGNPIFGGSVTSRNTYGGGTHFVTVFCDETPQWVIS